MKAIFQHYDVASVLSDSNVFPSRVISKNCRELIFDLPASTGQSTVFSYRFSDGVSLFLLSATLTEDWEWVFSAGEISPLFVLFLASGNIEGIFHEDDERYTLQPLETFFALQPGGGRQSLIFKKGEPVLFAAIKLKRAPFLKNLSCLRHEFPAAMQQLLFENQTSRLLFPADEISLEAVNIIQSILRCKGDSLAKTCFTEGKTKELLALNIRRLALLANGVTLPQIDRFAYQAVSSVKEHLANRLHENHTIEDLARLANTNRQKLKTGFKRLTGKTIGQYLRYERMEKAKALLLTSDASIREIALAVGYENPSHFARRFREHTEMLPLQFAALQRRREQNN
jgi:AraC-like DNA-binding protein